MPQVKMTNAKLKIALNKANKEVARLRNIEPKLADANKTIACHVLHMDQCRETNQYFKNDLIKMEDELAACSEAFHKSRKDNKILIKKLTVAWNVMGQLAGDGI